MNNLDAYPMILTPAHVSKILNLPKNQTYNLFRSKSFPSERIGGKHIIPKPRFLNWLGEKGEIQQKGGHPCQGLQQTKEIYT